MRMVDLYIQVFFQFPLISLAKKDHQFFSHFYRLANILSEKVHSHAETLN